MGKYLAIVLVVIVIAVGAYFLFFNRSALFNFSSPLQKMANNSTTSTDTLDQNIDTDMTALEKDLQGLDAENAYLINDLNSL